MFTLERNSNSKEKEDCRYNPSFAERQQFLSQIVNLLNVESGSKSLLLPNRLAVAVQLLQKHNCFVLVQNSGVLNIDSENDGDNEDANNSLSVDDGHIVKLVRGIISRIGRLLLSYDLRPISQAAISQAVPHNKLPSISSLLAFENYCRLAGCDAACAALRDQRTNWLHAEIGGTLTPQSSRSPNTASARTVASAVVEPPVNIVALVDRISIQCDADLACVVQVAGRSRFRQFADLFQTASNDCAIRVKQQAVGYFQSTPSPSLFDLSQWLLACFRAEQLRCRESFLHQAGQCVSVRPKSGSLLKMSSRPYSDENEHASYMPTSSTLNDAMLVKLFGDAITLAFAKDYNESKFDTVSVAKILPVLSQADADRWPKCITKNCCILWDVFGTFVHLFFTEPRTSNVASQQSALENAAAAMRQFLDRRSREFSAFLGTDFASHEPAAYIVISDLCYLERQLNSLKLVLASTGTSLTQRVISELRELLRGQLDGMYARIIAIHARLLLESLLHDWRQMPSLDGNDDSFPVALIAWGMHLTLWYKRISRFLSNASVSHIFLSVALASFERISARLINSGAKKQDSNVALRLAVNIFFIALRSPELAGSNFSSTFSAIGRGSADSPTELRDLIASFNSLGNTLWALHCRNTGATFQQKLPTDWILASLGLVPSTMPRNEDMLLMLGLLIITCHPSSCHSLTVRVICSPRILHHLTELLVAADAKDSIITLLQCLRAASSSNVEPTLVAYAIFSLLSISSDQHLFSSYICSFLTDMLISDNQCLALSFNRCRLHFEASMQFQSLPCGCPSVGLSDSALDFIDALPAIFESLDQSTKLAIGAYDCALNFGGFGDLITAVIRKIGQDFDDASSGSLSTDFLTKLSKVAEYSSQIAFDKKEERFLFGKRRHRQLLSQLDLEMRDDFDQHILPVFLSLRKITTEKFLELMKTRLGDCHDDNGIQLLQRYYHQRNDSHLPFSEDFLSDATGNELFAAVCSFPQGLEILTRMQDILCSYADKMLSKLLNGSNMEMSLLDIARTVELKDPFSLVNCILSTAKNAAHLNIVTEKA